jgi:predicted membrane metal-binding protein
MRAVRVSTWPFRNSRAFNETVSRDHRQAKLLALLVPAGVVAVILPYSRLLFAAVLLYVCWLFFVLVPTWARDDATRGRGQRIG